MATSKPKASYEERRARVATFMAVSDKTVRRFYEVDKRTAASIGGDYGISTTPVLNRLKAMGVELRQANTKDHDIDEAELKRLYVDEELSISQCAEKFNCSEWPIKAALDAYGIPKRAPSRRRKLTDAQVKLMVRRRNRDGATFDALADEFGVSSTAAADMVERYVEEHAG